MSLQRDRVLFVLPSLGGGGSERVFSILLRHLDRDRFEPHLALLNSHGSYITDLPPDVVVHELKTSRVRYALPGLVNVARKVRPRTVLSTLAPMNLALTMVQPFMPNGTRLLIREAAMASWVLPNLTGHPRIWKALYKLFYPRADKIICLSDAMVEDLAVNFKLPRSKLVRIYNPVDIRNVRNLASALPGPYSGPGPHLVAAGRFSPEKGFDLLLSAMSILHERVPEADLTILGAGPLAGELIAQAERLGLSQTVRFAGFQQNPWPYFKHATTLVLPSRYEGLPNVVLEALALETPVVAFDCPGALRELKAWCNNLVMVPPQSPQALADAITSVCNESAAMHMGSNSALAGKFGVEQIVSEYSNLLLS